jgi:hypothetical protein
MQYKIIFPPEVEGLMDKLSNIQSISKEEIVRRSIALYGYIYTHNPIVKKAYLIGENGSFLMEVDFQRDENSRLFKIIHFKKEEIPKSP